jgi:hypothetical protein
LLQRHVILLHRCQRLSQLPAQFGASSPSVSITLSLLAAVTRCSASLAKGWYKTPSFKF